MLVAFHLAVFVVNELFTPQWQKNVRDISREVVAAMREINPSSQNLEKMCSTFSASLLQP